jgi:arylformamidase
MKKIFDVTVLIERDLPTWPSDPGLKIEQASSMAKGGRSNVTRISMGAHTGTHMDAPFHFEPDGYGIDQIPLDALIGPCRVYDFSQRDGHIDRAKLERCDFRGVTRALFKTKNSQLWARNAREFDKNFIAVVADGADFLVERGVKLVGVDYLSVEPYGSGGHPVHHRLLRASVAIVEGLSLHNVPAGDYELMALPIKLKGADGAPARVVLREL